MTEFCRIRSNSFADLKYDAAWFPIEYGYYQHMRVVTHKGTWDKVVKAYEDKISEAIPQT